MHVCWDTSIGMRDYPFPDDFLLIVYVNSFPACLPYWHLICSLRRSNISIMFAGCVRRLASMSHWEGNISGCLQKCQLNGIFRGALATACWRHYLFWTKTSSPWWPEYVILCLHNKLKQGTVNFLGNDKYVDCWVHFWSCSMYLTCGLVWVLFLSSFFPLQRSY